MPYKSPSSRRKPDSGATFIVSILLIFAIGTTLIVGHQTDFRNGVLWGGLTFIALGVVYIGLDIALSRKGD